VATTASAIQSRLWGVSVSVGWLVGLCALCTRLGHAQPMNRQPMEPLPCSSPRLTRSL